MSTIKLREVNAIGATPKEFEVEGMIPVSKLYDVTTGKGGKNPDIQLIKKEQSNDWALNPTYKDNVKSLKVGELYVVEYNDDTYGHSCVLAVCKSITDDLWTTIYPLGTLTIIDSSNEYKACCLIQFDEDESSVSVFDVDQDFISCKSDKDVINIYKL